MAMLAPATPKSWYLPSKPHKFCPGCGHGITLKALGEAIDELGIQQNTIFGCDIGCSLLAWNFFACDSTNPTFDGCLHFWLAHRLRVLPTFVV
jgi:2-oxoglutarate ferredoxin oxidoreductase subunit beta